MKYIRNFKSLDQAKGKTLYSPTVTKVTENGQSKMLAKNLGKDVEMTIPTSVTSLDDIVIKKQFIISYNSSYGECPNDKKVEESYGLKQSDLPTLSEEGYVFKGWNASIGEVIISNKTLNTSWEEEQSSFTITYVSVHGSTPIQKTVISNYSLQESDLPTLTDSTNEYVFNGWSHMVGFTITTNTTITAEWKQRLEYEWVDLGLSDDNDNPILFATCNVGASSPKECGEYFAWGEIQTYYRGSASNPTWRANGTNTAGYNFTTDGEYKYVNNNYKEVSGITQPYDSQSLVLTSANDAATVWMGEGWRMPMQAELQKLYEYIWDEENHQFISGHAEWIDENHQRYSEFRINGLLVKGIDRWYEESTEMFLPASGRCSRSLIGAIGDSACLWGSSLTEDVAACYLFFDSNFAYIDRYERYLGFTIRGIYQGLS